MNIAQIKLRNPKCFEAKCETWAEKGFFNFIPKAVKSDLVISKKKKKRSYQVFYVLAGYKMEDIKNENGTVVSKEPKYHKYITTGTETYNDSASDIKLKDERVVYLEAKSRGCEDVVKQGKGMAKQVEPTIFMYLQEWIDEQVEDWCRKKNRPKEDLKSSKINACQRLKKRLEDYLLKREVPIQYFSQLQDDFMTMRKFPDHLFRSKIDTAQEKSEKTIAKEKAGKIEVKPQRTLKVSTINDFVCYFKQFILHINKKKGQNETPIRDFWELERMEENEATDKKNVGFRLKKTRRKMEHSEARKVYPDISLFYCTTFANSILSGCREAKVLNMLESEANVEEKVFYLLGYDHIHYEGIRYDLGQKNDLPLILPMSTENAKIIKEQIKFKRRWEQEMGKTTPFLYFVPYPTKGNKDRTGHPRSESNYLRAFYDSCGRQGIDHTELDIQALRKTHSIDTLDNFIDESLEKSRDLLGHQDVKVTKKSYYHPTKKVLDGIRQVMDANPIGLDVKVIRKRYAEFNPRDVNTIRAALDERGIAV